MKKAYLTLTLIFLASITNAQNNYVYSLSYEGINPSTGNYQIALIATPNFATTGSSTSWFGAVLNIPSDYTINQFEAGDSGLPMPFEWSASQEVSYDGGVTDLIQLTRQEFIANTFTHSASQPLKLIKFDIMSQSGSGNPTTGEIALAANYTDSGSGNFYENFLNINTTGSTTNHFSNFDPTANSINFSTLSIPNQQIVNQTKISVYPNPTKGELTINTNQNISYSIYNVLGQSVKLNGQIENNKFKAINLSHLQNGIYILKTEDENKNSKSFKIIKKE